MLVIDKYCLSIITVCFENLEEVKETFSSFSNACSVEWILVDGSRDEKISSWVKTLRSDLDVKYIHEPDEGVYDAMNKGTIAAEGEYVIYMNSGDVFWDEKIIDEFFMGLSKRKAEVFYGDSFEIYGEGQLIEKKAKPLGYVNFGMFAHHQAMFFKRSVVSEFMYDCKYIVAADYDLVCKTYKKYGASGFSYLPFSVCRFGPAGISLIKARLGRKEAYNVRRRSLGQNIFVAFLVALIQWVRFSLRKTKGSI